MGPGDSNDFIAFLCGNLKTASADNGDLILTDLIAFRQIRVEVVFPCKDGHGIDRCTHCKPECSGHEYSLAVHHGEHPRKAYIDCTGLGVG